MSVMIQYYVTFPEGKPRDRGFKLQSCKVVEPGSPSYLAPSSSSSNVILMGSHLRNLILATEVQYSCLQKICPVLTPEPLNVALFGKRIFAVVVKDLELGSSWT